MCPDRYQKLVILSEQMCESQSEDSLELDNTDIEVNEKNKKGCINEG